MKILRYCCLLLLAFTVIGCASNIKDKDLRATSTDYFQYSYNSNYYRNPLPYYTLNLFSDGENTATGAFYERKGGETFAFKYQGAPNQLGDIKVILDEHNFDTIKSYAVSGSRTNHAARHEIIIRYKGSSHRVVWDRRYFKTKQRDEIMKPLIAALHTYLRIPQIIEQFDRERENHANSQ